MDPALTQAFETTWPAAEYAEMGGFRVGRGLVAGRRINAAHSIGDWTPADIDEAINVHMNWQQRPLFRVLDDEVKLRNMLEQRGFLADSPTLVMDVPVEALTDQTIPPVTTFTIWPPLAIQHDIWTEENIGPARRAVMERVRARKTSVLGRIQDRAAGTAFVAIDQNVAMINSLEVAPEWRRKGLAGWMIRQAAFWAAENGASRLALAVLSDNAGAISLYESLGFRAVSSYRYYAKNI